MEKTIFPLGITALAFACIFASCSGKDGKPPTLQGNWRIDSVTHPSNPTRTMVATMMIGMLGGKDGLRYEFSSDSMLVRANGAVIERMAYTFRDSILQMKDTTGVQQVVHFLSDSMITITPPDSISVHLRRVASQSNK